MEADPDGTIGTNQDIADTAAAKESNVTRDESIVLASSAENADEEAVQELSEGVKSLSTEPVVPAENDIVVVVQEAEPSDDVQAAETDGISAATTTTVPSSTATTISTLSIPGLQKKFTSLSVNKQFLEKASPTITASTAPIVNKVTTTQPLGRLVSSSPASRLTSAKLSTSISKPPSAGWGQIASPGLASPGTDPLPSGLGSSSAIKNGASGASPKLVTALTSGSAARSTSPHQKGSPGLRNASLAASGRSGVSGSVTSSATNSKAPWAAVKTESSKVKSALASDFPTAAEAARAKLEAERREKAAAAEAAARAEQTLQQLERYRGTSIGPGNHWDEMDDEDDLDEVVQFGDGTQYKVPAKKEEEPVSKEERFKDVGHDRSWPLNSSQQSAAPPTTQVAAPVPRPLIATRNSSTRDPSLLSPSAQEAPAAPPKLFNSRHATKLEIKSGESVSLETEVDRGYSNNQRGSSFYRRDRDGGDIHAHTSRPSAQAHTHVQNTTAAPVRAWGPLAQRQASLNPDAPKPAITSPPASQQAASIASPTLSAATSQPLVRKDSQQSNDQSVRSAAIGSNISNHERALPPHLVAQTTAVVSSPARVATKSDHTGLTSEPIQAAPYSARFGAQALSPTLERPPPTILKAENATPVINVETQREEMLSAAERARKRRQEEEEKRLAEKERAKAKAAAIEEKMRLAKEEDEKQKKAEQEALLLKKAEAEEKCRQEVAKANSPAIILESDSKRDAVARPALLSPSDEAVSWRKTKPTALMPPEPSMASGAASNSTASVDQHAFQDIRPMPLEVMTSQPVKLLQRPTMKPSADSLSPTNGKSQITDVSKTRNGNAMVDQKSPSNAKVPTGPRGNIGRGGTAAAILENNKGIQIKGAGRAPRVDIIAPTDDRAVLHREEQERQREARQSQKSSGKQPVGVLKTSASVPLLPPLKVVTSKEVEFEGVPVWNRYKIKVGTSKPLPRLPYHIIQAQKYRVAESQREGSEPRAVDILSWDPPMPYLSSRTLSRDDLFHAKKYRKGTIIASVAIPKGLFDEMKARQSGSQQEAALEEVPLVVKVPSFKTPPATQGSFKQNHPTTTSKSNGLRSNAADIALTTVSPSSRESLDPVTYSTSIAARVNTPSPVSFMTNSEVNPVASSQVSLPLSPMPVTTATITAPSSAILPTNANSTWGQTSLYDLNTGASGKATADRERIREVWAHSSHDGGNVQNSLKDIVDEFPDMPAQYHDVGINTNESSHHSAPASRVYSPVVTPHNLANRDKSNNGYGTSASSPSFATAQGLDESEEGLRDAAAISGRGDLKRGYPPSQQRYSHDQRRPYNGNAFSAYAYPSPIDEGSQSIYYSNQGRFASHHNQHQLPYQQHRYAAYDNGPRVSSTTAYGGGGGAGSSYGSYRSSSNPPSHSHQSANLSGMGSDAYGSPNQHYSGTDYSGQGHQNTGNHHRGQNPNSPNSMRNLYPQGAGAARPSGASNPSMRSYRFNDTSSTVW